MDASDRDRKKAWKLQQRKLAQDAFPISDALLESLFEMPPAIDMSSPTLYLEASSAGNNREGHSAVEVLLECLCRFAGHLGLTTVVLSQKEGSDLGDSLHKAVKFVAEDDSALFEIERALYELSRRRNPKSSPLPADQRISVTLYLDSPVPNDLPLLPEDFLVEIEDWDSAKILGKYVRLIRGPRSVRVTHLPTGTSSECNSENISRKQHEATGMLVARLVATHRAATQQSSDLVIHEYAFREGELLDLKSDALFRNGNQNAP
ncbi:MAG: hypothetical protein HYU74_04015 [Dechloromonas sp.]|nr:hypothetical protein [Dechloromonas sp.]